MPCILVFAGLTTGNFLYALLTGNALSEPFRDSFFQGVAIAACYVANLRNCKE